MTGSGVTESVTGNRIKNGIRIKIDNGTGAEIENRTEVENECGFEIRIVNVTEIGSKAKPGLRLPSINKKMKQFIHIHVHGAVVSNYMGKPLHKKGQNNVCRANYIYLATRPGFEQVILIIYL
ncbi:hypothetical protein EVAR_34324_1 [Eumeta japonica]|uniref:Uncharacterized protein n=1 Tax=Eumeta variegata TaxID=151549 RepID=A0A4C1VCK6_EUMVA|nr:hypothetical protein EVAR_34324_1 [Eumeta japonica]